MSASGAKELKQTSGWQSVLSGPAAPSGPSGEPKCSFSGPAPDLLDQKFRSGPESHGSQALQGASAARSSWRSPDGAEHSRFVNFRRLETRSSDPGTEPETGVGKPQKELTLRSSQPALSRGLSLC